MSTRSSNHFDISHWLIGSSLVALLEAPRQPATGFAATVPTARETMAKDRCDLVGAQLEAALPLPEYILTVKEQSKSEIVASLDLCRKGAKLKGLQCQQCV